MTFHWPQITELALMGISIGVAVAKHGEPKREKHNAPATIIAMAVSAAILYYGGFFG